MQKKLGELIEIYDANVVVVFREETDGLAGLAKTVERTGSDFTHPRFTLALNEFPEQTKMYSPGKTAHDCYIIDPQGTIQSVLTGLRYARVTASEFATALHELQ